MSGFCGWVGKSDDQVFAKETTIQMAERLSGDGSSANDSWISQSGALLTRSAATPISWHEQDAICAAIEGYPRWTDPDLASLALREGHGAALAYAFREYGDQLLKRLYGDFAIAVINADTEQALFAVDRTGVRTLCVSACVPGIVVFGSTTDSVSAFPGTDSTISAQTIFDYLYFVDRIPAPKTIFDGQEKLLPGEFLSFTKGTAHRDFYWRMPVEKTSDRTAEDLSSEMFRHMRQAVSRCVDNGQGDTIGAFLSGGLDSSTVVGLLAETTGQPPQTFTIGFDIDAFDETEYARLAVKHFGGVAHEYNVTPTDVYESIPKIAAIYDEPFGNASAVPVYFCAKLAKEAGVNVLLAGDGGDELFAGNSRYVDDRIFDHYDRVPAFLRNILLEPLLDALPDAKKGSLLRKARNYIRIAKMSVPGRMTRSNIYATIPPDEMFTGAALGTIDVDQPLKFLEAVYNEIESGSVLRRTLNLDLRLTLADSDLRKVNRMCEIAGVQVQYPFLDDDLLEFSAGVPDDVLIVDNQLRHFYKQAMKGFLPEEIVSKKKHGFGLPFVEFTRRHKPLQELVYDSLNALKSRAFFAAGFLESAIKHHRNGDAVPVTGMVWDLMMLELWFQSHLDRPDAAPAPEIYSRAVAN